MVRAGQWSRCSEIAKFYPATPGVQLLVALLPVEHPLAPLPFRHGFTVVPPAQVVLAVAPAVHLLFWSPNRVPKPHADIASGQSGWLRSISCGLSYSCFLPSVSICIPNYAEMLPIAKQYHISGLGTTEDCGGLIFGAPQC